VLFLKPFGRSIDNQMKALFFAMRGRCIDHALNDIEAEGYVCALLIFLRIMVNQSTNSIHPSVRFDR